MMLNTAPAQNAAINSQNKYLSDLDAAWRQHLVPRADDAPTIISTFAGCGGSSLGYSMAGFRELLAVEWNQNAADTFQINFPNVSIYQGDIARLSVDECLKLANIKVGELDVFDGSPPCQGFSMAGKRIIDDPRNQLFKEYVRLLRGLQPKVFVMENVSGLVKGKMRLVFADILKELKVSGYRVSARLMNAMYFNVPQSRERMIFIGVRSDLMIDPSHPAALRVVPGCVRLDAVSAKYSHRRYGDTLEKEGKPTGTITRIGRKFWNVKEEFGPLSYQVCGSFPLQYSFCGKLSDIKERIGNSVPPLFMKAIAEHIQIRILDSVKLTK